MIINVIIIVLLCIFIYGITEYKKYNTNVKNKLNVINNKPDVKSILNFISNEECVSIIKSCDLFKQSETSTGVKKNITKSRTSETTFFKTSENIVIDNIRDKISKTFNIDKSNMEIIQITKYNKGQEYKYHHDYFKEKVPNQRKSTFLIYLNDLSINDGGLTQFYFGDSYIPKSGTLIYWDNVDNNGKKNKNTLHRSTPIITDNVKYILTLWTRENPIQ